MKRRHISLSVKLDACLDALGLLGKPIHWHHSPALSHRPRNAADTDYEPAELDPRYLRPVLAEDNLAMARGNPAIPLSGETSIAAKLKRLERAPACREAFAQGALAADAGETADRNPHRGRERAAWAAGWHKVKNPQLRSNWPKRAFPSRKREAKQ